MFGKTTKAILLSSTMLALTACGGGGGWELRCQTPGPNTPLWRLVEGAGRLGAGWAGGGAPW